MIAGPPDDARLEPSRLYDELRALARSSLQGERPNHTFQSADLVHEALLKLDGGATRWSSRREFFAAASRTMRQILVDHARSRHAQRRDVSRNRPLEYAAHIGSLETKTDILDLDEALRRLAESHPDIVEIVEMRFFAGLELEAIASLRGVARRTIDRAWAFAKSWLHRELGRTSG